MTDDELAVRKDALAGAVAALKRSWELRCESYDPWPEGDADAVAQHVFETLLAGLLDHISDVEYDAARPPEEG